MSLPSNGLEAYVLAAVVVIFNAGGILYLAKNHFAHVNRTLRAHNRRLKRVEKTVNELRGYLKALTER